MRMAIRTSPWRSSRTTSRTSRNLTVYMERSPELTSGMLTRERLARAQREVLRRSTGSLGLLSIHRNGIRSGGGSTAKAAEDHVCRLCCGAGKKTTARIEKRELSFVQK